MFLRDRSLRAQIEKWFPPSSVTPIQITRLSSHKCLNSGRCVLVKATRSAGSVAIHFFQHRDGSWCVFPQTDERPAINDGRRRVSA